MRLVVARWDKIGCHQPRAQKDYIEHNWNTQNVQKQSCHNEPNRATSRVIEVSSPQTPELNLVVDSSIDGILFHILLSGLA